MQDPTSPCKNFHIFRKKSQIDNAERGLGAARSAYHRGLNGQMVAKIRDIGHTGRCPGHRRLV